jgi:aromatic ring hydroxylase-like protein
MPPTATSRARRRAGERHIRGSGDGRSLYDAFGFEWTLLRLGLTPPRGDGVIAAARRLGLELDAVDVPAGEARDLYDAPLALIRPDQIVGWRGFDSAQAADGLTAAAGYPTSRCVESQTSRGPI